MSCMKQDHQCLMNIELSGFLRWEEEMLRGFFFFLLLITSVFQSDFIPVNKYRFRRSCNWLCVTSPRCHNRFMKLTMANLISLKNNYYYIITNHICNICSTTVICMSNMREMSEDTALETVSTESPGLCWLKNSGCSPKCWNSNQSLGYLLWLALSASVIIFLSLGFGWFHFV